jgi:hypothetical protein
MASREALVYGAKLAEEAERCVALPVGFVVFCVFCGCHAPVPACNPHSRVETAFGSGIRLVVFVGNVWASHDSRSLQLR